MVKQTSNLRIARRNRGLTRVVGHLRTIGPAVTQKLIPQRCPPAKSWRKRIPNERGEAIIHSGLFADVPDSRKLVILLHGMGGTVDRGYCVEAAVAARRVNLPCLRLALRGADGLGRDMHHAGFTDDLQSILELREFDRFEKVALVGYSLGGHVSLSAAVEEIDERLMAVAALCPPLDLRACQEAIDAPRAWLYRQYLLRALKQTYPAIARGGQVMVPPTRIDEVSTLREWDALTVVPRFGFDDVDHYYATQSVGPKLATMETAALVVSSPADPMIPADSLRGALGRASQSVAVRWVRDGGHVFFPPRVDLGFGERLGVENQVMAWVADQLR